MSEQTQSCDARQPSMFRRKQDFSSAISQQFRPDDLHRYGLSGTLTASAFDPVQSLAAVGTGHGSVHIFGEGSVQVDFKVRSGKAIRFLDFVRGVYLIIIDAADLITVYALDKLEPWAEASVPGQVSCRYADPAMDWLFIGLSNGQTVVFDVDRGNFPVFRIENIQKQVKRSARLSAVASLELHPRDPSTLLLCYNETIVAFSLVDSKILFTSDVPQVATFPAKFTSAQWHPSGSHVLTLQNDGNISFWDGQSGTHLATRTMAIAPGSDQIIGSGSIGHALWCSHEEAESTFLFYSNGNRISLIEYGQTPVVAMTKYETMGKFFVAAAAKHIDLTSTIVDAVAVPRKSPHFNGRYDPAYILVLLDSNEQKVIRVPKLEVQLFDSVVLPPALSWRAAKETCIDLEVLSRNQWMGMMLSSPRPYLRGGTPSQHTQRKTPLCTVVAVGGSDGAVKLFDGTRSTGSDFRVLETSISGLIPDEQSLSVVKVSMAGSVGEMAVASSSGNVYLFSFKKNTYGFDEMRLGESIIQNVAHRSSPEIREGFLPQWAILNSGSGTVTALAHSDIGFVAVGYGDSRILVIDRRGPAIIFQEELSPKEGIATVFSFGIQAFQEDGFSSILLSCGTSTGEVILYKILPRPEGGFQLARAALYTLGKGPILHISHIDLQEGKSAAALPAIMAHLSRGVIIPGGLLALGPRDARIFNITGSKSKLSHKSFETPILGGGFTAIREGDALGLVTVNVKGKVTAYSIPGLSALFSYPLPYTNFAGGPVYTSVSGNVLISLDEHSSGLVGVWGVGEKPGNDSLYREIQVPPRPTISATTWIGGRQFVRVSDLDIIIGGSRRAKSRRANASDLVAVESEHTSPSPRQPQSEGWGWGSASGAATTSGRRPTASQSRMGQKTWAQTFDEYYDSAEGAVNETLDGWMDSIKGTKKSVTNNAVKGVIRNKLGF